MKTRILSRKGLAILFGVLMLFQSCRVYRSQVSNESEVITSQVRTKVVFTDGHSEKYNQITLRDGALYGIRKGLHPATKPNYLVEKGQTLIPIDRNKVQSFHSENKSSSTTWTVISIAGVVAIIAGVIIANDVSNIDLSSGY